MIEYNACWIYTKDLPKFLEDIRMGVLTKTTEIVETYIANLDSEILVNWLESNNIQLQNSLQLIGSAYIIMTDYYLRPGSIQNKRTPYNLDASLNIYLHRNKAYINFDFPKFADGFMYTVALPEYANDFSFKVGQKRPEDVTNQQWRTRRLRWVELEDKWGKGIKHTILSYAKNDGIEEVKSRIKDKYGR